MPSRMDRYNSNNNDNIGSRSTRNEQLYKELYSNKTYTEFTDIDNNNVFDLSNSNNSSNRRSSFSKAKLFYDNGLDNITNDLGKTDLNIGSSYQKIFDDPKDKNYNINDILETAKRNRTDLDEEEKKRKIKSVEYSILSDLSQEKLKEYHDRKEKGITKDEEENIEELIHTITSKSLRKKIDNELLSDLMPDDEDDSVISKNLLEELEQGSSDDIDDDTIEQVENTEDLETGLDRSFYTRSMDLKREDLILKKDEEELDESFADDSGSTARTIIIIILALLVIGSIGYIIYNFI